MVCKRREVVVAFLNRREEGWWMGLGWGLRKGAWERGGLVRRRGRHGGGDTGSCDGWREGSFSRGDR